jgi:hypothetical protein
MEINKLKAAILSGVILGMTQISIAQPVGDLDVSDPKVVEFIKSRFANTGQTLENSPELFRSLDRNIKNEIQSKSIKKSKSMAFGMPTRSSSAFVATEPEAKSNVTIGNVKIAQKTNKEGVATSIHALVKANFAVKPENPIVYAYTDVVLLDKDGKQVGNPGVGESFTQEMGGATAEINPAYIINNYTNEDAFTSESFVYAEYEDGTTDYKLVRSAVAPYESINSSYQSYVDNSWKTVSRGEPVIDLPLDKDGNGRIDVCLNRNLSYCDYDTVDQYNAGQAYSEMDIQMPFEGNLTSGYEITKIYHPGELSADDLERLDIQQESGIWLQSMSGDWEEMKNSNPDQGEDFIDRFFNIFYPTNSDGQKTSRVLWSIPAIDGVFENAGRFANRSNVSWRIHLVVEARPRFNPRMRTRTVEIIIDNDTAAGDWDFKANMKPMYFAYGCVAKGTHITLADLTSKPVEEIVAGDVILANGMTMAVANISTGKEAIPMYRITDSLGHSLLLTEKHPVLTKQGTLWASELSTGNIIFTEQGEATIVEIDTEEYDDSVHNLKLEVVDGSTILPNANSNAFFANGILVGDLRMQNEMNDKEIETSVEEKLRNMPSRWREDYLNSIR